MDPEDHNQVYDYDSEDSKWPSALEWMGFPADWPLNPGHVQPEVVTVYEFELNGWDRITPRESGWDEEAWFILSYLAPLSDGEDYEDTCPTYYLADGHDEAVVFCTSDGDDVNEDVAVYPGELAAGRPATSVSRLNTAYGVAIRTK